MSDILDEILETKREYLRTEKATVDVSKVKETASRVQPLDFESAIQRDGIQLIAEIKPKAPSAGKITELSPDKIAWVYQEESPAAVSVLTDEPYFGMTDDDFRLVRGILQKPILRKEFIVDPFQVHRSAAMGADAILLIASVLAPDELQELYDVATGYGLQCLVEVHSLEEWEAIPFQPEVVGINNRTLEGDFSTDLSVTERLAPELPEETTLVSESGISTHEDVERLARIQPVDAILVGTSLLKDATDPSTVRERIRSLLGE